MVAMRATFHGALVGERERHNHFIANTLRRQKCLRNTGVFGILHLQINHIGVSLFHPCRCTGGRLERRVATDY